MKEPCTACRDCHLFLTPTQQDSNYQRCKALSLHCLCKFHTCACVDIFLYLCESTRTVFVPETVCVCMCTCEKRKGRQNLLWAEFADESLTCINCIFLCYTKANCYLYIRTYTSTLKQNGQVFFNVSFCEGWRI